MAIHVRFVALALGDKWEFPKELLRRVREGLLAVHRNQLAEIATLKFAAQLQVPIFGEVLRLREFFFLSRGAVLLATDRSGALPEASVALVDLHFATENFVSGRH